MIVGAPVFAGICLFILPLVCYRGHRAPSRRPWAVAAILLIVTSVGALWWEGERAPWSPDFAAQPLTPQIVHAANPEILRGVELFNTKGCLYCHSIEGRGGHRGPDLTSVADRLTDQQITLRILNGGYNMPSFASSLKPTELTELVAFLNSRSDSSRSPTHPP